MWTLLALLVATLAIAQEAPQTTASIEGIVVHAETGAPIPGAEVRAFWANPPAMYSSNDVPKVLTDASGRFVFPAISANAYRLHALATGYVRVFGDGPAVSVGAGETARSVVIRLKPAGTVSGRVVSVTGEPLPGIEVVVLRQAYDANGWRSVQIVAPSSTTNDRGEYRIPEIPPGRYYVRATRSGWDNSNSGIAGLGLPIVPVPAGQFTAATYATTYYPGDGNLADASLVEVRGGVEVPNINFSLTRQAVYRIRGRVVDPASPNPPPAVSMSVSPWNTPVTVISFSGTPYRAEDGSFELIDLIPGTYLVIANIRRPMTAEERKQMETPGIPRPVLPMPPTARAIVEIKDSDVTDVVLRLARDVTVRGRITAEGRPALAVAGFENTRLDLHPILNGQIQTPQGRVSLNEDGTFSYTNIPPGDYWVSVRDFNPDAYIREARIGDLSVVSRPLSIEDSPADLLVMDFALDGGRVNGQVRDSAANPRPNAQVVLVPSERRDRTDLYRTAIASDAGAFDLRGVAPGDYNVFAFDRIDDFRYFDPDFISQHRESVTRIRVAPSSTTEVNPQWVPIPAAP